MSFAKSRLYASNYEKIELEGSLVSVFALNKEQTFVLYRRVFKTDCNLDFLSSNKELAVFKTPLSKKFKAKKRARKKDYKNYLLSEKWLLIRKEMIEKAEFKCNRCRAYKEKGLQVHHRTYDNFMSEKPEDLEVLCKPCHQKEHKRKF